MRRLWAAGAVMMVCLTSSLAPAWGHWAKEADMQAVDGTGNLDLEIVDIVGMEGLRLEAGVLWGFDWPSRVISTLIEASPFHASGSALMEGQGTQIVLVRVFGEGMEDDPVLACSVEFDLRAGEDVWMRASLPPDPETATGAEPCLVHWLLHHDPRTEPPHE